MKLNSLKWITLKVLIFLVFYSILHFLWVLVPIVPFAIIAGTSESVMQHMKLAFYAYIFTTIVEYLIFRKTDELDSDYLFVRIFSSILIGWLELLIWYIVPVFIEDFGPLWVELTYSFVVLILCVIWLSIFELNSNIKFSKNVKILIITLLVITIFIYTAYSFMEPFLDVFHVPDHTH